MVRIVEGHNFTRNRKWIFRKVNSCLDINNDPSNLVIFERLFLSFSCDGRFGDKMFFIFNISFVVHVFISDGENIFKWSNFLLLEFGRGKILTRYFIQSGQSETGHSKTLSSNLLAKNGQLGQSLTKFEEFKTVLGFPNWCIFDQRFWVSRFWLHRL